MLTRTQLAGTADAVTTTYTYEPQFFQLATVTDPLTHTWTLSYTAGTLSRVSDPLNHTWEIGTGSTGQITSVTDPLSHRWTLAYTGTDLTAVTNPLGATWTAFADAAGRVRATSDPLGQTTRADYDRLNRLTGLTDAIGGQTSFAYDANSNLVSLTDALTHATTYGYNSSDRVETRTDPLQHSATYAYDPNNNLTQLVDRKGQVTSYQYDALDRLQVVTFADTSTITYTYDAGDRVTQIADSANGTITRQYDGLDRLIEEATAQGTVSYTYDAAGRRTTMTVAGQPAVTYGYDDDDRLTSIIRGSDVVTFTYDAAHRRSTLTYPNGIVATSGYDAANQLATLTYTLAGNALGDLQYSYDGAGNRIAVGGSWARTGLPSALTSAAYDAANRVVSWNGTAFSYDPNGNLTSDGLTSYSWNARNQLIALSGANNAAFSYDAIARRRAKTITALTTQFLYDDLNVAQELSGTGSPVASLLTGLVLDESLLRSDSSGSVVALVDGLGSTSTLADGTGVLGSQFTYQPFGATEISGAPSGYPAQFTGRENDGTGLLYYRARYYSTQVQRFISEDPIEFAGGVNLFEYVGGNPIRRKDPLGLDYVVVGGNFPVWPIPSICCIGVSGGFVFTNGQWYWTGGVGAGTPGVAIIKMPGNVSSGWSTGASAGFGWPPIGMACEFGGGCGVGLSTEGPWTGFSYTGPLPQVTLPDGWLPYPPHRNPMIGRK